MKKIWLILIAFFCFAFSVKAEENVYYSCVYKNSDNDDLFYVNYIKDENFYKVTFTSGLIVNDKSNLFDTITYEEFLNEKKCPNQSIYLSYNISGIYTSVDIYSTISSVFSNFKKYDYYKKEYFRVLNDGETDIKNICDEDGVKQTFQIIGYLVFIIKILIPLLLIVLGTIDFTKAITTSDDKSSSEAIKAFVTRIIIALIIFFIPSILNFVFSFVDGADETSKNYSKCSDCLFSPLNKDKCSFESLKEKAIKADQKK